MLSPGTALPARDGRAWSTRPRLPWPPRRIGTAVVAGTVYALAVGIPTGVVPSSLYTRMTPVQWWNYPVWAISAVLGGLVVATYVRRPGDPSPRSGAGQASGGGLLAAFAVGCPVCNKLVVAAIGVSGAMTIWAPIQPLLGIVSILGLAWALRRRVRSGYACSVGGRQPSPGEGAPEHADSAAGEASPTNEDADVGAAGCLQPDFPLLPPRDDPPAGGVVRAARRPGPD